MPNPHSADLATEYYFRYGGHMADNHWAAVIFWDESDDGPVYLVVEYRPLEYDPAIPTQIKFAGGTNNDHPGETPLETALREVRDELSLVLPHDPEQIYMSDGTPNRGGGLHRKYAFMSHISEASGDMRREWLDDNGDQISPPFWRTSEELLKDVKDGGLFWTHRPMLHAAIAVLRRRGKYPQR